MGHDDWFRDQEPDDEHAPDDETAASTSGYDETAMRQDQGGRPPTPGPDNDLAFGDYEADLTEDDPEAGW
ncbi:hypothetical protein OHR68_39465 [Spirillospora sp. NBC_00431]